jgi:DNA (cytosine-5)-methyltransferase 1
VLTVGSLFSGIGGFDFGFERAGMRTLWFAEQNDYCRRVLARHWPGVPCYPDVRALVGHGDGASEDTHAAARSPRSAASEPSGGLVVPVPVPYVDVLAGGFPCQDLSYAGKGAGIDGERSGLWSEYARLIRELRPRYVVVENVPALLGRGLGRVLGDLAACGYDAEWDCLPASAFGAPHRRDRVWVVAYAAGDDGGSGRPGRPAPSGSGEPEPVRTLQVADADGSGRIEGAGLGRRGWWESEPDVGRVAHGVPARVDRLAALGNALVPAIAQWLGERILEYEEGRLAA